MPSSKSSVDKRDVYYRKGKSEGYRARSAYKLLHLDEEFDLFRGVSTAVDLCAAPGSWSQVLSQQLKPGRGDADPKIVSIDLQPMAPLPNITLLQRDITLPSTVPLVLDALGGRKANLVVCDGAPDVTGVHDLDAYLHSQLLLAALTLSLTLLAPGSTLIFKIFLSPLDPNAAFLRSQLREFFPGPADASGPTGSGEFDDEAEPQVLAGDGNAEVEASTSRTVTDSAGNSVAGYDPLGRRGGVWVRKPRSSRKGSGEAFIVCRNFDPTSVPLPPVFTASALDNLREATGTLTLESLASLGGGSVTERWTKIKAYVGSGDLGGTASASQPRLSLNSAVGGVKLQIQTDTPTREKLLDFNSQPTPIESVSSASGLFPPTSAATTTTLRAPKATLTASPSMRRALAANHRRRTSADSNASDTSPTSATSLRPWDRVHGPPSPLPSPMGWLHVDEPNHLDIQDGTGPVSPALSTGSKTDLFFAASQQVALPIPPKPLSNAASLGRGPAPLSRGAGDRSASTPFDGPPSQAGSREQTRLLLPDHHRPAGRAVTTPVPPRTPQSPRLPSERERIPSPPLSSHPTLPSVVSPSVGTSSPSKAAAAAAALLKRRESQFRREQREVSMDVDEAALKTGDVLVPTDSRLDEEPIVSHHANVKWRLVELMGEGAFSGVWSAVPEPDTSAAKPDQNPTPTSLLAAIKTMSKRVCSTDSRTRIAFVREVEVLRHISHPNIVAFLGSFSTETHHCLVLERLKGGEMFDLVSKSGNRERMLMPGPGDESGEGFVRRVFGELCTAVAWLHEVGVVHRDIKMENILFTSNPFALPPTPTGSIPLDLLPRPLVKLTDFGLSRFINPSSPLLATRCGSENFAAPEIIMGRMYDGRLTDAWAVGVVLYALLAGELPFDEGAPVGAGARARASSGASGASGAVTPSGNGMNGERERGGGGGGVGGAEERRRRMMRIAKGEYAWRSGVGTEASRAVVAKLLVRDPSRRARVIEIWENEWLKGPGAVDRPGSEYNAEREEKIVVDGVDSGAVISEGVGLGMGVAMGSEGEVSRGRKVWAGYVVDGAGEMARAESIGPDPS